MRVKVVRHRSIYSSLTELVKTPKGAHAFVMDFIDRTEGKPRTALRCGAFDYVSKPFTAAHLEQVVEAAGVHRGR